MTVSQLENPRFVGGFLVGSQEQTGALEEASAHVEGLGKSLKATWRFRHLMIKHRDPWEWGIFFVKAGCLLEKGCDGHELLKIPAWKLGHRKAKRNVKLCGILAAFG